MSCYAIHGSVLPDDDDLYARTIEKEKKNDFDDRNCESFKRIFLF